MAGICKPQTIILKTKKYIVKKCPIVTLFVYKKNFVKKVHFKKSKMVKIFFLFSKFQILLIF